MTEVSPRSASVCLTLAILLHAAASSAGPAFVHGVTTARDHTTRLPGVEVIVIDAARGVRVATVISDDSARFELSGLGAGRYRIVARLAGFVDVVREPVVLADDQNQEIDFNLVPPPFDRLNIFGEREPPSFDRQGREPASAVQGSSGPRETAFDQLPVPGEEYGAMFPVRPALVRAPDGRLSLKGVHDADSGRHIGRAYVDDPSSGYAGVELAADSIDSVAFVPNPYSAEGREPAFAAVHLETRSGGDLWRGTAASFVPMPCLKLCDGASAGVRTYRPSGWFGGPLVKKRLFIGQGLQFRLARVNVPTQPAKANDTTDWGVEAFTRADLNLAPGHTITARFSAFPRHADRLGLSTFLPATATPDFDLAGSSAGVSTASTLTASLFLESAFSATAYTVDVYGQGQAPLELTIDGAFGNFFNTQTRRTRVLQWTETLAGVRHGATGEHLWRGGVDVTWATFDGSSVSRPVIVRRADGTISERLTFGGESIQHRQAAGGAFFIQDRWRMAERVLVEPGLRVERDGTARQTSVSPRIGLIASVFSNRSGVVRGGAGVFHELTPLNRGVFDSYETTTAMRFASDGVALREPPSVFVPLTSDIRSPRTLLWNLEYEHRLRPDLLLKIHHLRRTGSRLAVIDPIGTGSTAALVLDGHGRSRYAETEIGMRLGTTDVQQLAIAYVRSHSDANLNAFDAYFGSFRSPIVRADEYSLASDDAPNRVLIRTVVSFREKWTVSTLTEVRSGLPYSVVDEHQQFVGARNRGGRFPNLWTVDAAVVRSASFLNRPVQIGLRAFQLLDTFQPRDVQNNIDSPAFGTFYNSIPRRLSVTVTFFAR